MGRVEGVRLGHRGERSLEDVHPSEDERLQEDGHPLGDERSPEDDLRVGEQSLEGDQKEDDQGVRSLEDGGTVGERSRGVSPGSTEPRNEFADLRGGVAHEPLR